MNEPSDGDFRCVRASVHVFVTIPVCVDDLVLCLRIHHLAPSYPEYSILQPVSNHANSTDQKMWSADTRDVSVYFG